MDTMHPIRRTDQNHVERHALFLERIRRGPIDLLFLGDSITRRWEEVPALWDAYYAHRRAANFGIGGDTIENLLWRIQNGELDGVSPKAIVLLIGTNNVPTHTAAEIIEGIATVLATVRMKAPEAGVLLLALFPRGPQKEHRAGAENPPHEVSPYYMEKIRAINAGLEMLPDDQAVRYLDIGSRFIGADGEIDPNDMPDGLHLVEPGYRKWAEAMEGTLAMMMGAP